MSIKLVPTKVFKSQEHLDRKSKAILRGQQDGHLHWFGGVPVPYMLMLYMEELTKAMPHVTFHPRVTDNAESITKFYAVMDNNPYALGSVGYGDISISKNGSASPWVCSRKIGNGKFAPHRLQHKMVAPKDIKKAVKEARKYLVPFTNEEIIHYMYDKVRDEVVKHIDTSSRKAQDLCNKYTRSWNVNANFMEEMKYLKDSGFKFATEFFSEAMMQIDGAYEEWNAVRKYAPAMTFVKIDEGEYPRIHVVKGRANMRQESRFDVGGWPTANSYSVDDLPEGIAGKVAVLQILGNEQYAVRVGYKYSNNIFWIERDLNNEPR